MTIQLTAQQQKDLDSAGAAPATAVDPRTNASYVLIPPDEYETIRGLVEDERRQSAIHKVALRNAASRMGDNLK